MGLSVYNVKKWFRMLTGTSSEHVTQGVGKCWKPGEISGYYNDLTEKIEKTKTLDPDGLPLILVEDGTSIYFPTAIIQYGLGAWDLYLMTGEQCYRDMALNCARWAAENQEPSGGWRNFAHECPEHPYSSMTQGEGASLLLRVCGETGLYREEARRALDFMLVPVDRGGTAVYDGDAVYLHEFTHEPVVLNGWIFSLFGLYDGWLFFRDPALKAVLDRSLAAMKDHLSEFDNGYWSMYNRGKMITSPFYHSLHIALLQVLGEMTGEAVFTDTARRWEQYRQSPWNRKRSFLSKGTSEAPCNEKRKKYGKGIPADHCSDYQKPKRPAAISTFQLC